MTEEIIEEVYDNDQLVAAPVSHHSFQRSESAQEIISGKPQFFERWALFIFLGILFLLFLGSCFVKSPDAVECRASLTASNAPKEIVPRMAGRLTRLFIHNNEKVEKNGIIGWLESTADHTEVIQLSALVDSSIELLNTGKNDLIPGLYKECFNNLGEVQHQYQEFMVARQLFRDYKVNGFFQHKREMLQNDILSWEQTGQTINRQKLLNDQDLRLAEETYHMLDTLYDQKVLSKEELRQEKSRYLNKQMQTPQLEASLIANETQRRDKIRQLDQLNHDIDQANVVFQQALLLFKSSLDDWKKNYLLVSPVEGIVYFSMPVQENQYLQPGRMIGYINPFDTRFFAEVNFSQLNFGKLDTGMNVQLRFDAYPYQETGFVNGTLAYISKVASDSGFLGTIRLNNGLLTNNRKSIPYKAGLKAKALVITKDRTLLQRLYYNLIMLVPSGVK